MVGGTTAYGPSPMSMAGIINDQTEAATITPEANPSRIFCVNAGMSRFIRNTKAAPKVVPRNGIRSVAKTGFMILFSLRGLSMQKYKVLNTLSIMIFCEWLQSSH